MLHQIYSYFFPSQQVNGFYRMSINELGRKREDEIAIETRKIAQRMKFSDPDDVIPSSYHERPFHPGLACADYLNEMNMKIYYNFLFLINEEDIPENLRLRDDQDSRQFSEDYVNDVISWIRTFLGMNEVIVTKDEKQIILAFIKSCIVPGKCFAIKKFILAHELSHLHFKHQKVEVQKLIEKNVHKHILSGIVGSVGTLTLHFSSFSWIPSVGTGILVYIISRIAIEKLHSSYIAKSQELEADHFAVKHVGKEGAIASFELARNQTATYLKKKKMTFLQQIIAKTFFNSNGDFRYTFVSSHPSYTQRLNHVSLQSL